MGYDHKGGTMTFGQYLQDQHSKQYIGFLEDKAEDFNMWLSDLDLEDWQRLGDDFADKVRGAICN